MLTVFDKPEVHLSTLASDIRFLQRSWRKLNCRCRNIWSFSTTGTTRLFTENIWQVFPLKPNFPWKEILSRESGFSLESLRSIKGKSCVPKSADWWNSTGSVYLTSLTCLSHFNKHNSFDLKRRRDVDRWWCFVDKDVFKVRTTCCLSSK